MLPPDREGVAERAGASRWPWPSGAGTEVPLVVGLAVLAAVLRFASLSHQSYWLDESQAVHELGLSFGAMLHAWSADEWNPPLYLIVAWPWAKLFGTGELGLRALSALLGVAVVPLLYLSGRDLISARAGLMAALPAAVKPFLIWYSQGAREYMLLGTLCAASLWCFARAWRDPTGRRLLWWALLSGLALLTQYFAGFLVAAEGLALVYRARSRASVIALGAMAVVLAPFVPHVLPRFQHAATFITGVPLSARLQELPVSFGLYPVYQNGAVAYGLLGAAALAAAVIALLVVGAEDRELRGAGIAALLAAAVLIVPLLLALIGHDDYIARGLLPGWLPLALVVGAACAAPRARAGGAILALVLVAVFVYGQAMTQSHARFQKRDWRAVAAALGRPAGRRAIVAFANQFATGPLSVYLRGVPWAGPGQAAQPTGPVTVGEVDVVGIAGDTVARRGRNIRQIGSRAVDGYEVDRFALTPPWHLTLGVILQRALGFLSPSVSDASVILQGPER
ncbi:MAG: glycosyltransferase family 39 protein [Solirubrobacteraceae bacterium]